MKLKIALVTLGLLLAPSVMAQDVVGRALIDGKRVELLSDQTWRFEDQAAAPAGCKNVHARLQFCGSTTQWQTAQPANADIVAAYRHDDRNYAQFIVEGIGTNDGMTPEFMRNVVIENAATATGQSKEDIVVIGIEDAQIDGKDGETVIYQFRVDGLQVVFANTIVVTEDLTVQAMTYSVAPGYNDTQRALTADFIAGTKIN